MSFKLFQPIKRGPTQGIDHREPMMSANPTISMINFNKTACKEYLQAAQYVQVFYDEEQNILGIKPLEVWAKDSYKLKYQTSRKGHNSATIRLAAFCKHYGLTLSGHYALRWNNIEKLIEIPLGRGET